MITQQELIALLTAVSDQQNQPRKFTREMTEEQLNNRRIADLIFEIVQNEQNERDACERMDKN